PYLLANEMYDELEMLLNKNILPRSFYFTRNKNGYLQFEYGNNPELLISKILNLSSIDDEYYSEFRIYTMEEFESKSDYKNSGGHGEVIHVFHKQSRRDMIIKKPKNCEIDLIDSIVKEISLLRFINRINPYVAVIIYGIIIQENCIYLVEEYMTHTLNDEFNFIKNFKNKEEYIKVLLQKVLIITNELN